MLRAVALQYLVGSIHGEEEWSLKRHLGDHQYQALASSLGQPFNFFIFNPAYFKDISGV